MVEVELRKRWSSFAEGCCPSITANAPHHVRGALNLQVLTMILVYLLGSIAICSRNSRIPHRSLTSVSGVELTSIPGYPSSPPWCIYILSFLVYSSRIPTSQRSKGIYPSGNGSGTGVMGSPGTL